MNLPFMLSTYIVRNLTFSETVVDLVVVTLLVGYVAGDVRAEELDGEERIGRFDLGPSLFHSAGVFETPRRLVASAFHPLRTL